MSESDLPPRSLLTEQAEAPRAFVDPQGQVSRVARGLGLFALVCLVGGLLAGFVWNVVVVRPVYVMGNDSVATTTERGLAQFFGADAWFSVIGLVGGALIGWLAWIRHGRQGWPVVPLAVVGSCLAGLLAWGFGIFLDSGDFASRIAAAKAGDQIPIELALRAKAALAVWPFGAVLPVLAASSLTDDESGPGPLTRLRLRRAHRRMTEALIVQQQRANQRRQVEAPGSEQAREAEQQRRHHQAGGQVGNPYLPDVEQP
ncbi:hypothetical protein [Aestuariimicrobium sp. T2.26MG-19.2B]|uniref:hypothetical protein n=1 Tax=Aestuariimicrobium sp. T2.26MG-19.2B TaxID=3040679 RepID=UPI002477B0D5|nr:hypothetical protein [Aestuariimicrobium sp. T2.26MG-19.2B]CAI9410148.1 hypothetical protein AESSP_02377 [Aestuariimicrobium sp. T2.26MG-19.2B]